MPKISEQDKNTEQRSGENQVVETDIPARLDRLPWSRWHTRIIMALGTSWLLDGLEVTLVGSLSGVLESKDGLSLTDPQVTSAATFYLGGAVLGAILFGYLTDRLARAKSFFWSRSPLTHLPPSPAPFPGII
jgi:hypothetical protein